MSVKIKINWNNDNVVSESVRIYRADSAFTPEGLPGLLTEIVGDVYEYEDLTAVEGRTYFYMLSAKLDEQEVFTECFDVVAQGVIYLPISLIGSSQMSLHSTGNVSINEPAKLAGDISISVIRKITPANADLILPTGWSVLFQHAASEYNVIYVLYKINDQDSPASSTPTNITAGCSHTIIFRPDAQVENVSAFTAHSTHSVTGTSSTFAMPTVEAAHQSYELNIFTWAAYASIQEPITIASGYTMIQSKLASDETGASAMCTFGKSLSSGIAGGSSVTISGFGTGSNIFKAVVVIEVY